MTKTKSTKRALLGSALALLVCVSMLVGSTFAWFTDSVTSASNKIQAGTLNIDMLVMDENGDYQSVKTNQTPIFTDDVLWEPGYTEWRNIKVSTTGNLALKYQMNIAMVGESSALADVIDVYYAASKITKPANRSTQGLTRLGTLSEIFAANATGALIQDTLIPGTNAEDYATIVLKMQESAGNQYQGLSIGAFDINIVATQLTYESDSFDNLYDEGAYLPIVYTAAELKSALENGDSVKLGGDINLAKTIVIPAAASTFSSRTTPTPVVLNLNGFNIVGNMNKGSTTNTGLIVNNGSLVIVGDNESTFFNQAVNGASLVYNTGTLTLVGGNYIGAPRDASSYPNYVVRNNYGGTVTLKGGVNVNSSWGAFSNYNNSVLNIEDANITHNTDISGTTYYLACAGSGAVINIYDGEFAFNKPDANAMGAPILGVWDEGSKINIYGGTFDAEQGALSYKDKAIEIYGGTFKNASKNIFGGETIEIYIPDGYKVVETNDGHTVEQNIATGSELKAQLKDSTTTYITAGEDIDLSKAEYRDSATMNSITVKDGKTLDLNEKTIIRPGKGSGSGLIIPGNATVTVKNGTISSADGDMTAVDMTAGSNATFENVKFVGNGNDMIKLRASGEGSKATIIFKNCSFSNAGVKLGGMNGASEIDVQFINCTFTGSYKMYDENGNALTDPHGNVHYTTKLIDADSNYLYGSISFDNCTFNYDASEYRYTDSYGVINISGTNNSYNETITLNLKDVTINCKNSLPVKYTSSAYKKNIVLVESGVNTYTNNGSEVNHDGSAK